MNALIFLCERHDQLTGSASFQDNRLNVLLTPNLHWGPPALPVYPASPDSRAGRQAGTLNRASPTRTRKPQVRPGRGR
jgi:hypothetical protein